MSVTSEALFSKYDSNKDGVLDKKEAGRIVKEQKGKTPFGYSGQVDLNMFVLRLSRATGLFT